MNKQHIQLPHNMIGGRDLTPNDLLVYATIKRFMNKDTKEAFPSLKTLSDKCGFSIMTIRKSITKLTDLKWITIRKEGRKNIYKFYKQTRLFERFSYDFLDNDLPPKEKAYILTLQQYMIKEDGFGKTSYTEEELAVKTNLSEYQIRNHDRYLKDSGALTITQKEDALGFNKKIKFYHLEDLGQAILFLDSKINKLAEEVLANSEMSKYLLEMISDFKKKKDPEITM